jgi:hypothetical protein
MTLGQTIGVSVHQLDMLLLPARIPFSSQLLLLQLLKISLSPIPQLFLPSLIQQI